VSEEQDNEALSEDKEETSIQVKYPVRNNLPCGCVYHQGHVSGIGSDPIIAQIAF
jgi:hypothetical protein